MNNILFLAVAKPEPAPQHGIQYYAFTIMLLAVAGLLVLFCVSWALKIWEQRRIIAHYQREEKKAGENKSMTTAAQFRQQIADAAYASDIGHIKNAIRVSALTLDEQTALLNFAKEREDEKYATYLGRSVYPDRR